MIKYRYIVNWVLAFSLNILLYVLLFIVAPRIFGDTIYESSKSLIIYFSVVLVVGIVEVGIKCSFLQILTCDLLYYLAILTMSDKGAYGIGSLSSSLIARGQYSQDMAIITAGILVVAGLLIKVVIMLINWFISNKLKHSKEDSNN